MGSRHKRGGRKLNAKGRTRHVPRFVQYFHWMLDSDAYKSLRPVERGVHMMLRRRFNGGNNGSIYLSVREVSVELRCSKDTASRAFKILEDRGFIKSPQRGSFHWKSGMASRWILTEEDYGEEAATKDFMRWKPNKENPRSDHGDARSSGEDGSGEA